MKHIQSVPASPETILGGLAPKQLKEISNMSQDYMPPSPKPPLEGKTFALSTSGDTVTVTDVDGVQYTYMYKPTCPHGTHLVWAGGILMCVPN
jgi:hypothetical protein